MLGDRFASNVFLVGKPDDDVGVAFFTDREVDSRVRKLGAEKSVFGINHPIRLQKHCANRGRGRYGGGPECGLVQPDVSRVAGDCRFKASHI